MKKILLVGLLPVVILVVFFMQDANALTARTNFSDNHYTYITPGGTKVCGDHLCKPGEWAQWVKQLMLNQIKKSGIVIAKNPQSDSTKPASYGNNTSESTTDGKITRVDTVNMGNGDYASFITVASNGEPIHRIEISTSSGVDVKKAWINPLWDVQINAETTAFDSSKMYVLPSDSVDIVVITDDKNPNFNLDSVG